MNFQCSKLQWISLVSIGILMWSGSATAATSAYNATLVKMVPLGMRTVDRNAIGWENPLTFPLPPGRGMVLDVTIRNTGRTTWYRRGANTVVLVAGNDETRRVHHSWWVSPKTVSRLRDTRVRPGATGNFRIVVTMPDHATALPVIFGLAAGTTSFADSVVHFTLRNPNFIIEPPPQPPPPPPISQDEPTIRIGIAEVVPGTVTISEPDANGVRTALGFDARPSWNRNINDNRFRGQLQIHTPPNSVTWLVNELTLEQYVRGIAEELEGMPIEHMKAMAIAARTYAYYHLQRGGKHKAEGFHLVASPADQVYKGVGFEDRAPSWVAAAEATRGIIAMYQDQPILAAFSSGTCGRTKSFSEVWGGEPGKYPYLVSVPDLEGVIPNCATLQGNHQVGLSAAGSRGRARVGQTYDQILKHYYTGIELKKIY